MVSGVELMQQVCVRRLYCAAGALFSDPTDNTIDVRDFLGDDLGPNDLVKIQGLCAQALLGDQRILSAQVVGTYDSKLKTLTLQINAVGANGPFSIVIAVTALTVQLLSPN